MINYEELLPADKKALEKAIENEAFDFQIGYLNSRIADLEQEMETCSQEDDYVADLNKEVNRLNRVLYQICKAKREAFFLG